jgi:hypothetical protein
MPGGTDVSRRFRQELTNPATGGNAQNACRKQATCQYGFSGKSYIRACENDGWFLNKPPAFRI